MVACANAEESLHWSVSPLLGVHSPSLSGLNGAEFDADLLGQGEIVIDAATSVSFDFEVYNPLAEIEFGTEAGVELELYLWSRDSIVFGLGVWEGMTTSAVNTELPFQGVLSQAAFERSANVSYMQYFFGWKHYYFESSKKYKLFSRITLHELFDVDYREQLVFAFSSGPADTFKRNIVMETQATGVLLPQFSAGVEWYLADWLSIGFDAGYMFDLRKSRLGHASIKNDLQGGDGLSLTLPAQLDNDLQLAYLTENGSYEKILLSFAGWHTLLRLSFHF